MASSSASPQTLTPLTRRAPTGTLITDVGQSTFYSKDNLPPHRFRSVSIRGGGGGGFRGSLSSSCSVDTSLQLRQHASLPRNSSSRRYLSSCDSRFPRLQDCAHFHYERVGLSRLQVSLYQGAASSLVSRSTECCTSDSDNQCLPGSAAALADRWPLRWASRALYHGVDEASGDYFFTLSVSCNGKHWLIRRSWEHLLKFDKQLHTCCYDRLFSQLTPLDGILPPRHSHGSHPADPDLDTLETLKGQVGTYLARFSQIAGNLINCAPVLSWLELDNRGFHLVASDGSAINTPAVAAVHVVKRYVPQLDDELPLEVGDMISVIDMPAGEESIWWRGKKELEVGFFPGDCVQLISRDRIPPSTPDPRRCVTSLRHEQLPVLRKQSKFASFFRSFLSNRPTRRRLKESGILRERIFGCDLGEYLMNASSQGGEGVGLKVPAVLIHCAAFIEQYGIIDGIYRLSGIQSNIQKLRQEFDADHVPDLAHSEPFMQDIHSVASVLKLYFRELPNPLLTHQLYDQFVEAVQAAEDLRLLKIHDVVSQLPPPHYRTLEYLMRHLARIASASSRTGMTSKNLAIVWAPNLLRSSESESSLDALKGVSVCAIAVEYLVNYAELIFSSQMQTPALLSRTGLSGLSGRPKSLAVSNPTKLLTLDQARSAIRANPLLEVVPTFVEVGAGSQNIPEFHTIIDLPKSRGKRRSRSVKDRKTSLTWRSILPGQRTQRKQVCTDRFLPLSVQAELHQRPGHSQADSRLSGSRSVESVFHPLRNGADVPCIDSPVPEEPVSAPVHPVLARSHSSPISASHNRSVSHESYFVRSGSLGLTRPKRIIDVVRTVRYDQCEGGLLVKLSFDENVENEMQVESGILNETLVAPSAMMAEVVAVQVRQAEQRPVRATSKRPYRALSPLVLRRHRSWVEEEHKKAGERPARPTTFPRRIGGVKRCLSASPKSGRRVVVERDAVSLVLGKRSSDSSSSSSSGRKSFRRSAAEEEIDDVPVAVKGEVSVVVVIHQQDVEDTGHELRDAYHGQMDENSSVVASECGGIPISDEAVGSSETEQRGTCIDIPAEEVHFWRDEPAYESSETLSPSLSRCSSSSSLHLIDADEEGPAGHADNGSPVAEESVVPTPYHFLFGEPGRSELYRTVSVPAGGAHSDRQTETGSPKRHSYFFGQTDPEWVNENRTSDEQRESIVVEQPEVRACYLFSQPIADLGSGSRVYSPDGKCAPVMISSSSLSETLDEIAKQLPSLLPVTDNTVSFAEDQVGSENAEPEKEVVNSSSIDTDAYRWMDSSSESLAVQADLPTPAADADPVDQSQPNGVVSGEPKPEDARVSSSEGQNVPDTPCSVRALRCRFEADRKAETGPKAAPVIGKTTAPLRSPTQSLKMKLDALSDVYASDSTDADDSVQWQAPPSAMPLSRKWSGQTMQNSGSKRSEMDVSVFRWPPERERDERIEDKERKENNTDDRKEDSKENSDTGSLGEENAGGSGGTNGRKGKKVSQMCQIFQTVGAQPRQESTGASAPSRAVALSTRSPSTRAVAVLTHSSARLLPQYYSSV